MSPSPVARKVMNRALIALALFGAGWSGGVAAQELAREGERVRVDHHGVPGGQSATMEGWLVRIHPGDSIVLATRFERERVSLRMGLVDRVQVFRVGTRAMLGSAVGTLAGVGTVFPFTESECSDIRDEVCFGRVTVVFGAAAGFLLGALVGSFFEVPGWVDVEPQSYRSPVVQPTLIAADGGVGLAAKVALGF